jgi:hypothetical protein
MQIVHTENARTLMLESSSDLCGTEYTPERMACIREYRVRGIILRVTRDIAVVDNFPPLF